jgi:hypothetical protein
MNVTEKIQKSIDRLPEGITFKYRQLRINPDEFIAAAKAIERLIAKNQIKRISTGTFYKPKKTPFGELMPREEELLKPYLFFQNKRNAYVTGTSLYNRLGLTTQVPKTIKIASRDKRITITTGSLQAKPVKSYVDVSNNNYYLLELLDVLKDFIKIPDLDKQSAIRYLLNRLKKFTTKERNDLIKIAMKYPPRSRAFLGALLQEIKSKQNVKPLKHSLNPLTEYNLGIKSDLSKAANWSIK